MRYVSDWLIEDKITQILIENNELSSNRLRLAIKESVSYHTERKRKNKRENDGNSDYVPSEAKISATIKQLLEWQWLQRREEHIGGLKKVFYSLSEYAKFGFSIAMNPKESHRLRDAYQMILKVLAGNGTFITPRYGILWIDVVPRIIEIGEMYSPLDKFVLDFVHKKYLMKELERAFNEALKDGVIENRLINNEIRYAIIDGLKKFVNEYKKTL